MKQPRLLGLFLGMAILSRTGIVCRLFDGASGALLFDPSA